MKYTHLLTIVAMTLLLSGCFYNPPKSAETPPTSEVVEESIDTSDWKTYKNTLCGFSFLYPGDLRVDDFLPCGTELFNTNNESSQGGLIFSIEKIVAGKRYSGTNFGKATEKDIQEFAEYLWRVNQKSDKSEMSTISLWDKKIEGYTFTMDGNLSFDDAGGSLLDRETRVVLAEYNNTKYIMLLDASNDIAGTVLTSVYFF